MTSCFYNKNDSIIDKVLLRNIQVDHHQCIIYFYIIKEKKTHTHTLHRKKNIVEKQTKKSTQD